MKILFVCKGNMCRSPAAKYLLEKKLRKEQSIEQIAVYSAGTLKNTEGQKCHPKIKNILSLFNCNASHHRATYIKNIDLQEMNLIVAMDQTIYYDLWLLLEEAEKERLCLFTSICDETEAVDIEDPIVTRAFFRTVKRINRISKKWCFFLRQFNQESKE